VRAEPKTRHGEAILKPAPVFTFVRERRRADEQRPNGG
jgi:hypothetical protein